MDEELETFALLKLSSSHKIYSKIGKIIPGLLYVQNAFFFGGGEEWGLYVSRGLIFGRNIVSVKA